MAHRCRHGHAAQRRVRQAAAQREQGDAHPAGRRDVIARLLALTVGLLTASAAAVVGASPAAANPAAVKAANPATVETAAPLVAGTAPCPPPRGLDDALEAVPRIDVAGARGSGVLITPDTVVTAAHVVGDAARALVTWDDGATVTASVDAVHPGADLARLQLDRTVAACPLELAGGRADIGGDVHAAGYTRGALDLTVTDGAVTAHHREGPIRLLEIDAPVDPGMSGGALLDDDQHVAGIVLAKHATADRVSFAVAPGHAAALVAGQPTTGAAKPSHGPADPVAKALGGATVAWLLVPLVVGAGLLVITLRGHAPGDAAARGTPPHPARGFDPPGRGPSRPASTPRPPPPTARPPTQRRDRRWPPSTS